MIQPYYADGGITLYHGDCSVIAPQLFLFDLLLTDPPYGLGKKLAGGTRNYASEWDVAPDQKSLDALRSICAHAIIWGGNYFKLPPSRGWLIWHKPDALPTFAAAEMAWTSRDANTKLFRAAASAHRKEKVGHPTQKPVSLMLWCLSFFPAAQTVLDPFSGSGTTLVAAQQMGLQATGIEQSEAYCEMAAKRLEAAKHSDPDTRQPELA